MEKSFAGLSFGRRMPDGLAYAGLERPVHDVEFLADRTWVTDGGSRHVEQQIFDCAFDMVRRARRLVLLDMFLYNEFQGRHRETTRLLSGELTELLLARKRAHPAIRIVVLTDPINTVYGSVPSAQFERLTDAGIDVVVTDLVRLRDSNPLYSLFWRLLVRPFGNSTRGRLPNPMDPASRVTLRSYLAALNFKANHRKVLVTDAGPDWCGLVTSGNPHDASSAHHNVALRFSGPAAIDLLETENAVLRLSGAAPLPLPQPADPAPSEATLRVLTESAIKDAALAVIAAARGGDRIDLATFYLSQREVIAALKAAHARGVGLRVLLDPNKDAFGRNKFGIPNRPIAAELRRAGIEVRWVHTHGEQCHVKLLIGRPANGRVSLLLGSANLTRRNIDDFNLETNVLLTAPASSPAVAAARRHFEELWSNVPGRTYSVDYSYYRNETHIKKWLSRFMEASGLCTF